MTRGTRYFLTGAVLIVGVGVGTALVAYYKGDLSIFKSRVGPAELKYVPADATGVAFANVHDIMNSEFRQKLHEAMPGGQGKNELFNETGIDIERDIQSVVAASSAQGDPSEHGLVLIRGLFDEGRIETLIRNHNGTVEDYKGKRLLVTGQPPKSLVLVFPETGLVMLGGEATVRRALDTAETHQDVTTNADLMKLISRLDGEGNTAWAVGGIEAVTTNPNVPAQVKEQLPGIRWMAVSAHVNGGVNGQVRAEAKDDKAAADLRAVVNGAIAAGHLVGGKDPKLQNFLNSLQLSGSGTEVAVAFNVPPDMLSMVGAVAGARRHLDNNTRSPELPQPPPPPPPQPPRPPLPDR